MPLYSLALMLGLIVSAPWWLFRMATTQRYREGLRERLGFVPRTLREAAQGKRILWLHAVSVGEVLAASRLIAELDTALGNEWLVVISTTTRTGQALARERFGAARVFYMPLDFAFAIRAYLRVLQPAALVLMESELWPRILHECGKRNIPTIVANARVSDRSFARATKFRALWSRIPQGVALFLTQSEEDTRRLTALGAKNVRTIGNLKYDVRAPQASWILDLIRQESQNRPIILAGSTVGNSREDEESGIITAWHLTGRESGALLILAPRHPERFAHVFGLLHQYRALSASDLKMGVRSKQVFGELPGQEEDTCEIILLDTIGDLASVYSLADIAFVGGSLLPKGGHNPLEPAQFGIPTIIGSHFTNFRDVTLLMCAADGIRIVNSSEELETMFAELLSDPMKARAMGERGRQVFLAQQGATQRAVEAILAEVRP